MRRVVSWLWFVVGLGWRDSDCHPTSRRCSRRSAASGVVPLRQRAAGGGRGLCKAAPSSGRGLGGGGGCMGLVGGELLDGGPRLVEDGRELAQLRRRLRGALLLPRQLL
eukprot:scaffold72150_cov47-Phaeocystis_antarctica.AAC.2